MDSVGASLCECMHEQYLAQLCFAVPQEWTPNCSALVPLCYWKPLKILETTFREKKSREIIRDPTLLMVPGIFIRLFTCFMFLHSLFVVSVTFRLFFKAGFWIIFYFISYSIAISIRFLLYWQTIFLGHFLRAKTSYLNFICLPTYWYNSRIEALLEFWFVCLPKGFQSVFSS